MGYLFKKAMTFILAYTLGLQMLAVPALARIPGSEDSYEDETTIFSGMPREFHSFIEKGQNVFNSFYGMEGKEGLVQKLTKMYEQAEKEKNFKYRVPFTHTLVNELYLELIRLKNQYDRLDTRSLDDNQLVKLSLIYTNFVYLVTFDLFALFEDDQGGRDFRIKFLNGIRPKLEKELVTPEVQYLISALELTLVDTEADYYFIDLSKTGKITRKVKALLLVPEQQNYLKALKLTSLSTILAKVHLYKSNVGDQRPLDIPKSCQSFENGLIPSTIDFTIPRKDTRTQAMDNMLVNNGLIAGTDEYENYYVNYISPDITQPNFTGLIPFEKYFYAQDALNGSRYNRSQIMFDDFSHFDMVFNIKMQGVKYKLQKLKEDIKNENSYVLALPYAEQLEKEIDHLVTITGEPVTLEDEDGTRTLAGTEHLTSFLKEKMQKEKQSTWNEVIPADIVNGLKDNQIKLNYPKKSSPRSWRMWALRNLADFFEEAQETSQYNYLIQNACSELHMGVCRIRSNGKSLNSKVRPTGEVIKKEIYEFLQEFHDEGDYLPNVFVHLDKVNENHVYFSRLWTSLQKAGHLPESTPNEWDFIKGQMESLNRWASLRLSYLMFSKEIKNQGYFYERQFIKHLAPLKLDEPLEPFHGNKILDNSEKEFAWKLIADQMDQSNGHLFKATSVVKKKNYYEMIRDISQRNLFTKADVSKTFEVFDFGSRAQEMREEIHEFYNSKEYERITLLKDLYDAKGDLDKQEDIGNVLFNTYDMDGFDAKMAFLEADTELKAPLYRQIVKDASVARLHQSHDDIKTICGLDIKNKEDIRFLHILTTQAQEEIKEVFKIDLPKYIQDVTTLSLTNMNKADKNTMILGLVSGVLYMGAIFTAGATLPLALALSTAAVGTQVYLAQMEYGYARESKIKAQIVENFADQGLTDIAGADEIERSYGWTAMEIAFIFPMLGFVGRTVQASARVAVARGKDLLRTVAKSRAQTAKLLQTEKQLIKAERKNLTKTMIQQTQVQYERYLLGLDKISMKTLTSLKALSKELTGNVVVKESVEQINKAFATKLSEFFYNDAKQLKRFLNSYTKQFAKAQKRILKLQAKEQSKLGKFFDKPLSWISMNKKSRMARANRLLVHKNDFYKVILELNKVDDLAKYIEKNSERLSNLFINLPFRPKEIPHYIFQMGAPARSSRVAVLGRIPGLRSISEGIMVKRLTSARNGLVVESIKESKRRLLKIPAGVRLHHSYDVYDAYRKAIKHAALRGTDETAKNLMKGQMETEMVLAERVLNHFKKTYRTSPITKMNPDKLRDLLFYPQAHQLGEAELIWNTVPAHILYDHKIMEKTVHRAIQGLAKYDNLDEFKHFISALKILSIKENPELLYIL